MIIPMSLGLILLSINMVHLYHQSSFTSSSIEHQHHPFDVRIVPMTKSPSDYELIVHSSKTTTSTSISTPILSFTSTSTTLSQQHDVPPLSSSPRIPRSPTTTTTTITTESSSTQPPPLARQRRVVHLLPHHNEDMEKRKPLYPWRIRTPPNRSDRHWDDDTAETAYNHESNNNNNNTTITDAATTTTTITMDDDDALNHIKAAAMQQYQTQCDDMVTWSTTQHANCLTFHEMDVTGGSSTSRGSGRISTPTSDDDDDITLLSDQGSWRSVWKVQRHLWWWRPRRLPQQNPSPFLRTNDNTTTTTTEQQETLVLKLLKFQRRDFDEETYQHHRIDAMTMERLTSSPHIVHIYGYCGQSVLTEYAATTARSLTKQRSLSSLDRLKLGRDIVQALSHLHSMDYPNATNITMTHNDLNMANAVAVDNQTIKLNDFNIGMVQRWNASSRTKCRTPVLFDAPLWKSPEEIVASQRMQELAAEMIRMTMTTATNTSTTNQSHPVLAMMTTMLDTTPYWVDAGPTDVYGLGNLLFQVLTKCQPWTHLEPDGAKSPPEAAQRKVQGELPFVPERYHANTTTKVSFAALHYAVQLCYQRNPVHRPTSYELLQKMNTAISWIEETGSNSSSSSKRIRASELRDLFLLS